MTKKIPAIHPGKILIEEFLEPMNLSQYRLAKEIFVPAHRIYEIVHGKRNITADTAMRLGRYFGISPEFWLNLQNHYDLSICSESANDEYIEIIPHQAEDKA